MVSCDIRRVIEISDKIVLGNASARFSSSKLKDEALFIRKESLRNSFQNNCELIALL